MSIDDKITVWKGIAAFRLKPTSVWHRSFGGDRARCGQLLMARNPAGISHTSEGVPRYLACDECIRRGA